MVEVILWFIATCFISAFVGMIAYTRGQASMDPKTHKGYVPLVPPMPKTPDRVVLSITRLYLRAQAGYDEVIIETNFGRWRGSSTVWRKVDDGTRASIAEESFLAGRWTKWKWDTEEADRERAKTGQVV